MRVSSLLNRVNRSGTFSSSQSISMAQPVRVVTLHHKGQWDAVALSRSQTYSLASLRGSHGLLVGPGTLEQQQQRRVLMFSQESPPLGRFSMTAE